jgi:hypothetical protein
MAIDLFSLLVACLFFCFFGAVLLNTYELDLAAFSEISQSL